MIANCTDGEARLVDGPSLNKGRLEVCHNQAWATVCSDGGFNVARVVCGQLGFQSYYGRMFLVKALEVFLTH